MFGVTDADAGRGRPGFTAASPIDAPRQVQLFSTGAELLPGAADGCREVHTCPWHRCATLTGPPGRLNQGEWA